MNRSFHIWKDSELLPWLEKNVNEVLDHIDSGESLINDYESKRVKRYQGPLPQSISRHIILSDIKGVSPLADVKFSSVFIFFFSTSFAFFRILDQSYVLIHYHQKTQLICIQDQKDL